ncbi:MAG TPA: SPW repeat protein [Solirubrobacteraceae bacterium]|nr:SPW repeat protein [Solirubrobacteraceae bacterium]
MTATARWPYVGVIAVSGWLLGSPWALGFDADRAATGVTAALAGALVVAAVIAWAWPRGRAPRWFVFVLALALYLSPWVFGFAGDNDPAANAWMFSTVILYLALIGVVEQRPHRRHQGAAATRDAHVPVGEPAADQDKAISTIDAPVAPRPARGTEFPVGERRNQRTAESRAGVARRETHMAGRR